MEISTTLLSAWRQKRTHGDIRRLVEYTGASKPTVIKALRHGRASPEMILKISQFYSEKVSAQDVYSTALNILSNGKATKNH